jgi:hypothetical protein
MVHAVQKGDMKAPSSKIQQAAKSISKSDAKDFASTRRKGLPERKEAMTSKQALDLMFAYVSQLAAKAAKNEKSASDSPLQKLGPSIKKHGNFFVALNEVYANKSAEYRVEVAKGLLNGLRKRLSKQAAKKQAIEAWHPELHDAPAPDMPGKGMMGQIGDAYKNMVMHPIRQTSSMLGGDFENGHFNPPTPFKSPEDALFYKHPELFHKSHPMWGPPKPPKPHPASAPTGPGGGDVNQQALGALDGLGGLKQSPTAIPQQPGMLDGIKGMISEHPYMAGAAGAGALGLGAYLYSQHQKEKEREDMLRAALASQGGGAGPMPGGGGGRLSRVMEYT